MILIESYIFLSWFGIRYFLNGDKSREFIYFFLFGIHFSGITFALVPPVKLVFLVADDKADRSLRCVCTSIYYGAGASDWVIMFGTFFSYMYLIDSLSNSTINVVHSSVSSSSIFFSKHYSYHSEFIVDFLYFKPTIKLNHLVYYLDWPSNLSKPFLHIVTTDFSYLTIHQYFCQHPMLMISSQTMAYLPIHQYLCQHPLSTISSPIMASWPIPLYYHKKNYQLSQPRTWWINPWTFSINLLTSDTGLSSNSLVKI